MDRTILYGFRQAQPDEPQGPGGPGRAFATAKAENCFTMSVSPHRGHLAAAASARVTRTSNASPQPAHLYSKIGTMIPPTVPSI